MKIHHVVAASLLALSGTGVQAATTLSFGIHNLGVGDEPETVGVIKPGDFSHEWTLDVSGENDLIIRFEDADTPVSGYLNITGMNVTGPGGASGLTFTEVDENWSFAGNVADGTYTIEVMGTSDGRIGALYAAEIAPVPLPPAALLFGSALVGLAGLRRRKNSSRA